MMAIKKKYGYKDIGDMSQRAIIKLFSVDDLVDNDNNVVCE